MAKTRKQQISTHFECLTVKVNPAKLGLGRGVFDVSAFELEETYQVLATYLKNWDDGSATSVFLLAGPGGAIVEKACNRFAVAEVS